MTSEQAKIVLVHFLGTKVDEYIIKAVENYPGEFEAFSDDVLIEDFLYSTFDSVESD